MEDNNVKEKKHFFHKKEKKTEVAEVPKKKKKVWLIVLVIAAIVIVLIGSAVKNMTSQIETAANMVEVEPVEKRDLSDSVSLKGTIAGQSKTNVMSLAAAEITAVNVQVGDIVKEGDPLVTLDQKDIEKQIAELKTNISNANAIAANDAAQKQESLVQNKQDQQDSLEAAQKAIDEAQSDVDKYKKKVSECEDYIYYLKNFLSISDIKNLLDPLNEHFDDQDSKNSFYTIYNEIFKLEHDHNTAIRDSIADVFHKSEATFAELKESKKKEQLQQFAFITLLGYDIYLRKQVIEKMIDELYQPESNNKAEKKKKK